VWSSRDTARSLCSRTVSSSSAFPRVASDTSIPPNLAFKAQNVVLLIPCRRQGPAVFSTRFLLAQDADDLFLGERRSPHGPALLRGRTAAADGGVVGGHGNGTRQMAEPRPKVPGSGLRGTGLGWHGARAPLATGSRRRGHCPGGSVAIGQAHAACLVWNCAMAPATPRARMARCQVAKASANRGALQRSP
jgi:hypothetical protein